jgi:hypothetical protein
MALISETHVYTSLHSHACVGLYRTKNNWQKRPAEKMQQREWPAQTRDRECCSLSWGLHVHGRRHGRSMEPGDEVRRLPVDVPLADVPQAVLVARPHLPRRPPRLLVLRLVGAPVPSRPEARHAGSHCLPQASLLLGAWKKQSLSRLLASLNLLCPPVAH